MSGIVKFALVAALLNGSVLAASAADLPKSEWLKDKGCALLDADAHPGDTVSWTGACVDGYADGLGTATFLRDGQAQSFTAYFVRGVVPDGHVISRWGQGWSYEGDTVAGRFNGVGILTTGTGDRFDGQWRDGRMNGFGVLLRANSERYTGDWKDDKPDGRGELRQADGKLLVGTFTNGKLAEAETPSPLQTSKAAGPSAAAPFGGVAGKTLVAVDGSSIALTLIEGGMELQVAPADGPARKTIFTFMTERMGTVVEDSGSPSAGSSVTGFFRLTGQGVEVRYADGHSAMLSANADGGVQMALDGDIAPSCRAWYPAGHTFSDLDKKTALNAYASKLGLALAASDTGNACAPARAPQAATITPALPSSPAAATPPARPDRRASVKVPSRMAKASYRIGDYQQGLETVAVKSSEIHLVDAPTTEAPVVVAAAPPGKNEASRCLKVDSDGSHWGFRNSCAFAVQFAYCMAGGDNTLTACGGKNIVTTSAAGSVAANGFGALMADTSLSDKDASHNFRWIACAGGAGEVAAHLDTIEPPAGRCERTRTASAN